jgi:hypothetical protein
MSTVRITIQKDGSIEIDNAAGATPQELVLLIEESLGDVESRAVHCQRRPADGIREGLAKEQR